MVISDLMGWSRGKGWLSFTGKLTLSIAYVSKNSGDFRFNGEE